MLCRLNALPGLLDSQYGRWLKLTSDYLAAAAPHSDQ